MCQSLSIAREGLEPVQNYSSFFNFQCASVGDLYGRVAVSRRESENLVHLSRTLGYLTLQAGTLTCFRRTVNENELKILSSKSEMQNQSFIFTASTVCLFFEGVLV